MGCLKLTPSEMIAEDLASFYDNPLGYVYWNFPWKEADTPLEQYSGPRKWQEDYLIELGEQIKIRDFDGLAPVAPIQISTASGHGIGKSCLSAWLILFLHDTRPFSKGTVTSNTSDQLKTKTWSEVGKWNKMSLTKDFSVYNAGKGNMNLANKKHLQTWRVDALTCREENSEAFAGQHTANSTPFYLFDEGSAIPQKIYEVAKGGLTDGEPMFFIFGNPTRNTGFFYETFGKQKHRWITKQIDSRDVEGTNKELFKQWIEDNGIDSDFVKVRILGKFPNTSVSQFIGTDIVEAAYGRHIRESDFNFAPVIITCDPAWMGDDKTTIWLRQGLMSKRLWEGRKKDSQTVAGKIAEFEDEYNADAVFIDAGMGNGIIDCLRGWKRTPIPVYFGGASSNPMYANKRAQMWGEMKKWLESGGCLPPVSEIKEDLTSPEYYHNIKGEIMLESKKDMKKRGLHSPDDGDGLAISFAFPVVKKSQRNNYRKHKTKQPRNQSFESLSYTRPKGRI